MVYSPGIVLMFGRTLGAMVCQAVMDREYGSERIGKESKQKFYHVKAHGRRLLRDGRWGTSLQRHIVQPGHPGMISNSLAMVKQK